MNYNNKIFYRYNSKDYILKVKFSDNPYLMVKINNDITELQKTQNILDNRVIKFLKKEIDILKTSDLGFQYIKTI